MNVKLAIIHALETVNVRILMAATNVVAKTDFQETVEHVAMSMNVLETTAAR